MLGALEEGRRANEANVVVPGNDPLFAVAVGDLERVMEDYHSQRRVAA